MDMKYSGCKQITWVTMLILVYCSTQVTSLSGFRFCGRELADALALVCNGEYNVAFTPEIQEEDRFRGDRRFKRGIVDECCRRGCSLNTLQAYCSPPSTPSPSSPVPDNIQIRKRSDQSTENVDYSELWNKIKQRKVKNYVNENKHEHHKSGGGVHHKFSPLDQVKQGNKYPHLAYKHSAAWSNKVKRNDLDEQTNDSKSEENYEDIGFHPNTDSYDTIWTSAEIMAEVVRGVPMYPSPNVPHRALRHHRDRLSSAERKHPNSKNKAKKDDDSGDTSKSKIGTISPYFLGRTLLFPSSKNNYSHL